MNEKLRMDQEERDLKAQRAQENKDHERDKTILIRKLKEEEKTETAKRLERQRQRRLDILRDRIDTSMARADEFQEERRQIHNHRMQILQKLEKQKMELSDSFSSLKVSGTPNQRTIQKIANEYNIDIRQIELRASQKLPRSFSSLRRSLSVSSLQK
jgi:hypothetical protein